MLVTLRLFAGAAQQVGASELELEIPQADQAHPAVLVGDIARQLAAQFPQMRDLVQASRWAVGDEFVELGFEVGSKHTLVMIPPVSGG